MLRNVDLQAVDEAWNVGAWWEWKQRLVLSLLILQKGGVYREETGHVNKEIFETLQFTIKDIPNMILTISVKSIANINTPQLSDR